jgi:hypothetical protein
MPQPDTKTEIANLALTFIGQKPITLFGETTTIESQKVSIVWPTARLAVLREHNWSFARQRIALVASTDDTLYGWDYAWTYPTDTHIIRKVFIDTTAEKPDPIPYVLFNGTTKNGLLIATNLIDDEDKCYAETTFTSEGTSSANLAVYDPIFIEMFAAKLGMLLAFPLTGDKDIYSGMVQMYNVALAKAKSIDANEERLISTRKKNNELKSSRG